MPVIIVEPEELQQLIRQAVSSEVRTVISSEINRILSEPEEDRLLTRSQAMEQLGIRSRDTMNRLEAGGDLHPVRIGNRIHYHLTDIQNLKGRKG